MRRGFQDEKPEIHHEMNFFARDTGEANTHMLCAVFIVRSELK
jgi:hypothetical protein